MYVTTTPPSWIEFAAKRVSGSELWAGENDRRFECESMPLKSVKMMMLRESESESFKVGRRLRVQYEEVQAVDQGADAKSIESVQKPNPQMRAWPCGCLYPTSGGFNLNLLDLQTLRKFARRIRERVVRLSKNQSIPFVWSSEPHTCVSFLSLCLALSDSKCYTM